MSKYEVRGVKKHRGHEGEPLVECGLYRDGMKVAVYAEGDWGSEARFWWVDEKAKKVEVKGLDFSGKPFVLMGTPEEAKLAAHCASLPAVVEKGFAHPCYVTPDIFVSDLATAFDNIKRFTKVCKTNTMFRLKDTPKGEYRVLKAPYSGRVKEFLTEKYGEQVEEIYNETIGQIAA